MHRLGARIIFVFAAVVCGFFAALQPAAARVRIDVDLSSQSMHVESLGGSYDFPISSARAGFSTPRGVYRAQRLARMHYSKKYHNSPMPHSIFFSGGYAIHGTGAVGQLGRPASHGCIRLSPANAATLFQLVTEEGARIAISGSPPARTMVAALRYHKHKSLTRLAAARRHSAPALAYAPQIRPAPQSRLMRIWLAFPPGR